MGDGARLTALARTHVDQSRGRLHSFDEDHARKIIVEGDEDSAFLTRTSEHVWIVRARADAGDMKGIVAPVVQCFSEHQRDIFINQEPHFSGGSVRQAVKAPGDQVASEGVDRLERVW